MKKIFFIKAIILLHLAFSSCNKTYTCACDADGAAPIENNYTIEVEAENKKDAREKCRQIGDECGLYPL